MQAGGKCIYIFDGECTFIHRNICRQTEQGRNRERILKAGKDLRDTRAILGNQQSRNIATLRNYSKIRSRRILGYFKKDSQ